MTKKKPVHYSKVVSRNVLIPKGEKIEDDLELVTCHSCISITEAVEVRRGENDPSPKRIP
jgi:hypothetical protein